MPLMSEGKLGPKPAKLRAIWRAEKRKRDQTAAIVAEKRRRGLPVSETVLDTLRMEEDTIAGRTYPVGITKGAWASICAEMNARVDHV